MKNIEAVLGQAAKSFGADLGETPGSLAVVMAQYSAELALLVGKPGYQVALHAYRDAIGLRAGLQAHRAAQKADQRMLGVIQALLDIAA